jgi:phosphoribosyl-ATP pyrophosphohydrolase
MSSTSLSGNPLERLADVIENRKVVHGGDPDKSYVARLLKQGPDAFLKKIGEEATEVVMASKDLDHVSHAGLNRTDAKIKLVGEVADLWFHCLIALAYYELRPGDVLDELARREGTSGIEEKALRKAQARELSAHSARQGEKL